MRLTIIASTLLTSLSSVAWAQEASTLSTSDATTVEPHEPIRAARRFAVAGELGWNGLAGLGVNLTYNILPQLAVDAGLGLSLVGIKTGVRARYNFTKGSWSPIAGVGFLYAPGGGDELIDFGSGSDRAEARLASSPYVQMVGGVNYTSQGGFMFMATAGYALLLKDENIEYVSGSRDSVDLIRTLTGSGIVLSTSLGYAF